MSWPSLPDREWGGTIRSLHRWSQMVGKVRLALAPTVNHWWHIPLYVSARGLTTSAMPYRDRAIELEFDLREHALTLTTSDGRAASMALRAVPVATFYADLHALLRAADVNVRIWPVPVEVADATPFENDTAPGAYDADHAHALHGALINASRVLQQFRGEFRGKASPVHFFWGGFDLAATRFAGRPAPTYLREVPNCPMWVMQEAYSEEVSSAGWWPGDSQIGPAFYTYMYPEPEGFSEARVDPDGAFYHETYGEFLLPYAAAAERHDPDAAVLEFLQSTYAAGSTLANWKKAA